MNQLVKNISLESLQKKKVISFTSEFLQTLTDLKHAIGSSKPVVISKTLCTTWYVFTDGAYEPDSDVLASVGAVLISPTGTPVQCFGEVVPKTFVDELLQHSSHPIYELVQFMCSDIAMKQPKLSPDEYYDRIKHLLDKLSKEDQFDAVRFTGKSNESALLWACTKAIYNDLASILTESLYDDQKAELCTAQAETGNSLVQKCLEVNCTDKVVKLCMSICDPSLRFKVLSICTSEGHSLFNQWALGSVAIEEIENLLLSMNENQRNLLITGLGIQLMKSVFQPKLSLGFTSGKQCFCCPRQIFRSMEEIKNLR